MHLYIFHECFLRHVIKAGNQYYIAEIFSNENNPWWNLANRTRRPKRICISIEAQWGFQESWSWKFSLPWNSIVHWGSLLPNLSTFGTLAAFSTVTFSDMLFYTVARGKSVLVHHSSSIGSSHLPSAEFVVWNEIVHRPVCRWSYLPHVMRCTSWRHHLSRWARFTIHTNVL